MPTILIAEDKESMREMLAQHLSAEGYSVVVAKDGAEAIQKMREAKVDLVVTDLKLPQKDGLEVLKAVKDQNPRVPVILITAYGTIETAVKAVKEGAYDFLTKPFEPDHLLLVIEKALETERLMTENIILKEEVGRQLKAPTIVGKSTVIRQIIEKAEKVAKGPTTVLLLGESGTGKELFARTIHSVSPRANGPFVAVNCAAIPRDLLESEMFGYERGAFTGATARKLGKFELADKGTIFLDEIGEMDVALQTKLLRVLDGDGIMRVGGTVKIRIDVRVVSASNGDLGEAIAHQTFREDLYYRLSVFPLTIPPLRDRTEDIPLLAEHFLDHYCREMKKEKKHLDASAMQVLLSYPWTGNVRELQNCMERAVILSDGPEIRPEHLGLTGRGLAGHTGAEVPLSGTLSEVGSAASRVAETRLIKKVLAETGGNKTKAAEILAVSYKTLLTKIKDYRIDKEPLTSPSPPRGEEKSGV